MKKIKIWWSSITGWKKFCLAVGFSTIWALCFMLAILLPALSYGASIGDLEIAFHEMLLSIGINIEGKTVFMIFFIYMWLNIFIHLIGILGVWLLMKRFWRFIFRKKTTA